MTQSPLISDSLSAGSRANGALPFGSGSVDAGNVEEAQQRSRETAESAGPPGSPRTRLRAGPVSTDPALELLSLSCPRCLSHLAPVLAPLCTSASVPVAVH